MQNLDLNNDDVPANLDEQRLLEVLRKHRNEVLHLHDLAFDALKRRTGRAAALADLEDRLRKLKFAMFEDIKAASPQPS
jgi:hypothetical protein